MNRVMVGEGGAIHQNVLMNKTLSSPLVGRILALETRNNEEGEWIWDKSAGEFYKEQTYQYYWLRYMAFRYLCLSSIHIVISNDFFPSQSRPSPNIHTVWV